MLGAGWQGPGSSMTCVTSEAFLALAQNGHRKRWDKDGLCPSTEAARMDQVAPAPRGRCWLLAAGLSPGSVLLRRFLGPGKALQGCPAATASQGGR